VTLEVALIALYRVVGSLPTFRWPLAGGLLAIFVDLTDLFWMDVLDLGGIPDYQVCSTSWPTRSTSRSS
jgi:hypothetical protein